MTNAASQNSQQSINTVLYTMLFSLTHHFLKICSDRPPWSMPGVANTTIGPGLSVYERSNGCTATATVIRPTARFWRTLSHVVSTNHSQTGKHPGKHPCLANLCKQVVRCRTRTALPRGVTISGRRYCARKIASAKKSMAAQWTQSHQLSSTLK